jgi:predicted component of type VI protein secretion system
MSKSQVVIGRGGKTYWVDLKLNTLPDVSREHCRIRRDPASGKFLIKDMSEFGTTVNDERIPSSVDKQGRDGKDQNIEVPLGSPSRIGLAGVIFMDFDLGAPK